MRWLPSWLRPAALYLGLLALLVVVSWQTIAHASPRLAHLQFPGSDVLGAMVTYDGGWYWSISVEGYSGHRPGTQSPVAFFPGYPLAMRYVGAVVGDNALAGILLTAGCGLGVAVSFWTWCRERMEIAAATTSLLALLLYPYGYYLYGVVYADAMFVFVTLLAFWAVERDRPLVAGVAGAVASFTRPVGLAVVIALVVRTLERRGGLSRPGWLGVPTRVHLAVLRPADVGVLLSLSGLVAYCAFLWHRFDDPFLFSAVEEYWGQPPGARTWFKVPFLEALRDHYGSPFTWGLAVQGLLALAAVATVPLVGRRFGWGYAAYLLTVIGMPLLGTKDFMGLGRYGMAAFPVFALIGEVLAERAQWQRRLVLACSGLGLVLAGAGFAHGFYIS